MKAGGSGRVDPPPQWCGLGDQFQPSAKCRSENILTPRNGHKNFVKNAKKKILALRLEAPEEKLIFWKKRKGKKMIFCTRYSPGLVQSPLGKWVGWWSGPPPLVQDRNTPHLTPVHPYNEPWPLGGRWKWRVAVSSPTLSSWSHHIKNTTETSLQ